MKVEGGRLPLDAADAVIATSDTDDGVSPFLRIHRAGVRACQRDLMRGRYLPDHEKLARLQQFQARVTSVRVKSLGNLRASPIREFFAERHCNLKKSVEAPR